MTNRKERRAQRKEKDKARAPGEIHQQALLFAFSYLHHVKGLSLEEANAEYGRRGSRLLWLPPDGCLACGKTVTSMAVTEREGFRRLIVYGLCQKHTRIMGDIQRRQLKKLAATPEQQETQDLIDARLDELISDTHPDHSEIKINYQEMDIDNKDFSIIVLQADSLAKALQQLGGKGQLNFNASDHLRDDPERSLISVSAAYGSAFLNWSATPDMIGSLQLLPYDSEDSLQAEDVRLLVLAAHHGLGLETWTASMAAIEAAPGIGLTFTQDEEQLEDAPCGWLRAKTSELQA